MRNAFRVFILGFLLVGCASPGLKRSYTYLRDTSLKEIEKKVAKTPNEDTYGLKIYEHRLPFGFKFKRVEPYKELEFDTRKYELLAQFKTTAQSQWYHYGGLTFYRYTDDESSRAYFCYPQVPLVWLTLGIWNAIPLHYPCNPHGGDLEISEKEDNRRRQLKLIKRYAAAMFATHIIIQWNKNRARGAEAFLLREI